MTTKKNQWFVWVMMIVQAFLYVLVQREVGIAGVSGLVFIALFARDEKNVFFDLDLETTLYFYIQCVAMCLMVLLFGFILAMDHGSQSFDKIRLTLSVIQIANILVRFVMTYLLIEQEEDRKKLYFTSFLMGACFLFLTNYQAQQRYRLQGEDQMKQNKRTITIIGCAISFICLIAAVLIGWNHLVDNTKGPKNEKEIGYYKWNSTQMDSFLDIKTFTYQKDRYEAADGGGDGAMSYDYLEVSMKGRKPVFWLKETKNQRDKEIAKTISWWKNQAEPVYDLQSESGCKMYFINPNDKDLPQLVFWKAKDKAKIEEYYTNFDHYNFTLTDAKTKQQKTITVKEAKKYAKMQQIQKTAKNVKKQYTIHGESKDHVTLVEFDVMTVGGKQYLGKESEWD